LQNLAIELGIAKNVKFLGHVTEKELPLAYERATVFAMPSIAELQSIATMEAMASGRPVVAADAMALPHLVHDGDNGYLFQPDDVVEFSDKLKRVLTASPEELERLSENSLHLIQAHDIERTITIFEGLYRGEGVDSATSDDNNEDYSRPIGLLTPALHNRVIALRERAQALRESAQEFRERVEERVEDARDEVRETLTELRDEAVERTKAVNSRVKKTAKKTAKKAQQAVSRATELLKGEDD
jgi:vacuolar-type H+-ATPase subunit H